jgi:curved DNA-binding protein CbpA
MMTVSGIDGSGQSFTEQTGTLELSLQGCKYFSRHALPKNTWLTLELVGEKCDSPPRRCRARVAWSRKSRNLPGLFQVGVEFEKPGNVWDLAEPPADWPQPKRSGKSGAAALQFETAAVLARIDTGTYYELLQVTADSSPAQIRQSYYALARQFHPDRHMDNPGQAAALHRVMDAITLAYKTLTNDVERRKYDQQLAASGAFTLGRQQSQAQKTAEECLAEARQHIRAQNIGGTILWLRKAVELEPNSAKYLALLARSLATVASFRREAAEHLQRAAELDPLNTGVRLQLAELYEEMKLPWRARPYYAQVLEIDAENSQARERLAALDETSDKKKPAKRNWVNRVLRHAPR